MEYKGRSVRIFWNTDMLDYLRRNFARTLNQDLADHLMVSLHTVVRKARELGLQKDPEWLKTIFMQRCKMAHMASRAKGYPGTFKKGERPYPQGGV